MRIHSTIQYHTLPYRRVRWHTFEPELEEETSYMYITCRERGSAAVIAVHPTMLLIGTHITELAAEKERVGLQPFF